MIRPASARPAAWALIAALVVAACGSSIPTASVAPGPSGPSASTRASEPAPSDTGSDVPSPSSSASASATGDADTDAVFDAIQDQVLALRELDAPADLTRQTIGEAELKAKAAEDFDTDNPVEYVAANERLYKALGLMPEGDSLRELFLELIGSQVAGFYRPDDKELYVVSRSGRVDGADKITFAHEYDHALQDANFDVFADQERLRDQSDEALARAAVYEGDATLLMSLWALPNLTPEELQEVMQAGQDPASTEILARTPRILVEGLLFPYNTGTLFVQPVQMTGGWAAVDALYEQLPVSTEQVLHPDKFQSREAPIEVTLPDDLATRMGDGWSVALEDTWGEFQTRVWLEEGGAPAAGAADAAEGWGGDRLAVLRGPADAWAVVLHTEWDSAAEAEEFRSLADPAVAGLANAAQLVADGDSGVTILVASSADALVALDRVFGATGA